MRALAQAAVDLVAPAPVAQHPAVAAPVAAEVAVVAAEARATRLSDRAHERLP